MTLRLPDSLELGGQSLRLRPWSPIDIEELTWIWQDDELQRRFGVEPPVTREAITAYVEGLTDRWRDGLQISLAVVADGTLVGGCDLDHLDTDCPDLGYWIAAPARQQGFATRAARALLDWATSNLELGVVHIEVEPDNAVSIAVAERLGFTRVVGVDRTDGARRLAVYGLRVSR